MKEENIPKKKVDVAELFGIETKMEVFGFETPTERVPEVEKSYVFDADTTLSILAGFSKNRRVMVQGYHGTGKSTHIEQVAARLNWPCVRVLISTAILAELILLGKML